MSPRSDVPVSSGNSAALDELHKAPQRWSAADDITRSARGRAAVCIAPFRSPAALRVGPTVVVCTSDGGVGLVSSLEAAGPQLAEELQPPVNMPASCSFRTPCSLFLPSGCRPVKESRRVEKSLAAHLQRQMTNPKFLRVVSQLSFTCLF